MSSPRAKENLDFAKLKASDKISEPPKEEPADAKPPPNPPSHGLTMMEGERELTTGMLSKSASFRLVVRGQVGVKEIEHLIKKLELDKEILAESNDVPEPQQ